MAELFETGKQCYACNRLDFLPLRCNDCEEFFCQFHCHDEQHNCNKRSSKIIENSETNVKKKESIYKHRCSEPGCKKGELVPIVCLECKKKFCIVHRHPMDHICEIEKSVIAPLENKRDLATSNKGEQKKKRVAFCCIN